MIIIIIFFNLNGQSEKKYLAPPTTTKFNDSCCHRLYRCHLQWCLDTKLHFGYSIIIIHHHLSFQCFSNSSRQWNYLMYTIIFLENKWRYETISNKKKLFQWKLIFDTAFFVWIMIRTKTKQNKNVVVVLERYGV